jgi:hypothetical protein
VPAFLVSPVKLMISAPSRRTTQIPPLSAIVALSSR